MGTGTVVAASTAASVRFGTSVTFIATITVATGVAAPTGGVVEFWNGSTYLGRGTVTATTAGSVTAILTTRLNRGVHGIWARFGSASHAVSNSGILLQRIT